MQIVGIGLLMVVLFFGFTERNMAQITIWDLHALVMVMGGSLAAIMISSTGRAALGTLMCVRELIPFAGRLAPGTARIEAQRREFVKLWRAGQRGQAVAAKFGWEISRT